MFSNRTDDPFNSRRLIILLIAMLLCAIATAIGYLQEPTRDPFAPELTWKHLEWWKEPLESNAFRRLATASSGILSVQFMEDGQHGWAVGHDGTILASSDGGRNWAAQSSGSREWIYSVQFLADGQHGWAVGNGGTIFASSDGGRNWAAQSSGSLAVLRDVQFLADGQRGWAVGAGGTILASSDGGRNWAAQSSGSQAHLYSVQFLADGQRGWAVGRDGTILASSDGGRNWAAQSSGSKMPLMSVQFLADGQRGWAVGLGGPILASSDGGRNWAELSSGSKMSLTSVQFLADGQRGWAVGSGGTILASSDGGRNWVELSSGSKATLTSVQFLADGQRGWAVGIGGTILASSDGGRNWAAQSGGSKATLTSVQFLADGQRVWAVGRDGTILASSDGGRSWAAQSSGSQAYLFSVQFLADGQRGWAVGGEGTILASSDGGRNWAAQISGSKAALTSVQFLADGQRGWAVGRDGTILASSDGGRNWAAQSSGSKLGLMSVQFLADGQRGWAVGDGGAILASSDGGRNWAAQSGGSKATILNSVQFFADGQHGLTVGSEGTILASSDGGRNWSVQNSGSKAWLESMHFLADGQRGWVVGRDGAILASSDGGRNWAAQSSGSRVWLRSVQFLSDGQNGIIVGHGIILTSRDGGASWFMPQYHRWLPPWLYAAWVGIFVSVFLALWREREITRVRTVDDVLISDEAVSQPEDDQLGHRELVAALSAFLRNRRTAPPLSLAISAPWGKGKSSVMRMLAHSLRRRGVRPVWFNAWHHQKEEVVLAALLENIRVQALPTWGIIFRLSLLGSRMARHYVIATLVAIAALFGVFVLAEYWVKVPVVLSTILQLLLQLDWSAFVKVLNDPQLIHVIWGMMSLLVAAVFTWLYGLRAFPEHPAVLLATLSEKFKTRHAEAQTVFRYKFARHFGDVCEALRPSTLTVFIDDLDRCSPEKALETLEAVNYLVSSGKCYVVLGMDKTVVELLVGLANEKLAKEMAEEAAVEKISVAECFADEVENRREYANQYLEKLINIEVLVPTAELGEYRKLASKRRIWKSAMLFDALPLLPLTIVATVVALIASVWLATTFISWQPSPHEKENATPAIAATAEKDGASKLPQTTGADGNRMAAPSGVKDGGGFVPADPLNQYPDWPVWVIFTGMFVLFLIPVTRSRNVVDDSKEFIAALNIWLPLAVAKRGSPRQVIRFVNKARFLAMRSRGVAAENGLRENLIFWEAFWPIARRWWKRYSRLGKLEKIRKLFFPTKEADRRNSVFGSKLPPEMLVALEAIREAFPLEFKRNMQLFFGENNWEEYFVEPGAMKKLFMDARNEHKSKFGPSQWPPTDEQLAVYRKWTDVMQKF